jgi:hypothetical protein
MIPCTLVIKGFLSDFAPPLTKQARSSQAVTENACISLDSIRPGDFIKLKLLGPTTIQFSGRFNSVDTDASFWQPPSLASKNWEFPYRPAIVASVEHNVVVRKGRKGVTLTVFPLMMRKEGLEEFPERIRSRFIPLAMLGIDSRHPTSRTRIEPSMPTHTSTTLVRFSLFPWILTLYR